MEILAPFDYGTDEYNDDFTMYGMSPPEDYQSSFNSNVTLSNITIDANDSLYEQLSVMHTEVDSEKILCGKGSRSMYF